MVPSLELREIRKRYGDFDAVKSVSLAVPAGGIYGLLGPNGAGKTSTIRMVMDITAPDGGEILFHGKPRRREDLGRIGYLPEERGLYRKMTVTDQLVFLGELHGLKRATALARIKIWLERLELSGWAKNKVEELSKGMQQKIQLVGTVLHEPDLVILDEPFSGLDPVNQQSLETLIRDLAKRGATVVFSTHVMAHAERLCERVVLLAKGRKAFDGTVDEARGAAPRRVVLEGPVTDDEIRALPGVVSVETDAAGIRTAALAREATAHQTMRAAFERGLEFSRFEMREPSLHDAFIVLTEGA